jgi:hypothetical protein
MIYRGMAMINWVDASLKKSFLETNALIFRINIQYILMVKPMILQSLVVELSFVYNV